MRMLEESQLKRAPELYVEVLRCAQHDTLPGRDSSTQAKCAFRVGLAAGRSADRNPAAVAANAAGTVGVDCS